MIFWVLSCICVSFGHGTKDADGFSLVLKPVGSLELFKEDRDLVAIGSRGGVELDRRGHVADKSYLGVKALKARRSC